MRREYSILVMMILCASTFAGCLGGGDLTEVIDTTGTVPDPMTVDEFATFMSEVDDGDLTPFGNITKAGTSVVICCTLNMDEGWAVGESVENATMTMTSMYDQELQRMMVSTTLSVTEMVAGVAETHTMENTRTMGAAPNGSSHEGVVNIVMSEISESGDATGDLIKYFAFDWAWDWDAAFEEMNGSDEDDGPEPIEHRCSGEGPVIRVAFEKLNDGVEDCPGGNDEGADWDGDGISDNWMHCGTEGNESVNWFKLNDGVEDCSNGFDETGIPDDMDVEGEGGLFPEFEIDDDDMANGSWALFEIVDVTTGEAKFASTIVDESGENITVTVSVIPTTPPTVTSMVMENETMSMSTSFLFGDEVVIDLVDTEGDGWMRGATDMMIGDDLPCTSTPGNCHIDGWMAIDEDDEWLEAPNENLYLHIMGPEPESPPPTAADAMGNDTDGSGTISWGEFVYAWNSEEDENMTVEEATEFSMLFNESDMHYWDGGFNDAGDGELNLSELEIFIDKMEMMFGPPVWHCSSTVGGAPDTTISFELVNDGTEDCGDGSDEPQDFDGDGTTDNWFTCMDESEDDSPPPTAAEAMGNDTDGSGTISFIEFRTSWEAMEGENMTWEELTSFSAIFNESDMHYWDGGFNDAGDGELNLSELEIFIDKMEMMDQTNISMDNVNDGSDDCENGSDEFTCSTCGEYEGDFPHIMANISISGLVDGAMGTGVGCTANAFTDIDGAVWGMCWSDTNNNGLVDHPDWFNMSTNDVTNGTFEILLYDADAGDYAGSMMPGFSGLLACITMLGACLFIRRKK